MLKGHFGKIYALSWAGDSHKLVSASQVRRARGGGGGGGGGALGGRAAALGDVGG